MKCDALRNGAYEKRRAFQNMVYSRILEDISRFGYGNTDGLTVTITSALLAKLVDEPITIRADLKPKLFGLDVNIIHAGYDEWWTVGYMRRSTDGRTDN